MTPANAAQKLGVGPLVLTAPAMKQSVDALLPDTQWAD